MFRVESPWGGDDLHATGSLNTSVAAGFGSTIRATGDVSLGDANSVNGFFSDGVLGVGTHTVTINDDNEAVLGSLTTLGDGTTGGRLVAGTATPNTTTDNVGLPDDLLLEDGKNMTGRGTIAGNFRNMGSVTGDGPATGEQIVFDDGFTVTGIGFAENVTYNGTYAPGLSPGVATGRNISLAGNVQIELGGTNPGIGDNFHDQIHDRGTLQIISGASLQILPWNNFQPNVGDEFEILVADGSLTGTFDSVTIDSAFAAMNIEFEVRYASNRVTLEAVAASPVLQSFQRQAPSSEITDADSVQFRAEFSEQVQNVDGSDFVVNGGSTASVTDVSAIQGTGEAVYLITVSGGDLTSYNGTVGLDVASGQDITDTNGNALATAEPAIDETYMLDNSAPQVESIVTDGGTSIVRAITVTFDSEVTIDPGAFELKDSNDVSVTVAHTTSVVGNKTQAVLTFSGTNVDSSESLVNGNYQLRILDTHVRDAANNSLDGDADGSAGAAHVDDFYRLFGDVNANRTVDLLDFAAFRQAFGSNAADAAFNEAFDANDNNAIDLLDFAAFRQGFGSGV